MAESTRDLVRLLARGRFVGTVAELAERIGASRRTAFRAVAEALRLNLVEENAVKGCCGRVEIALLSDHEERLKRLCRGLGRESEAAPGHEYTTLVDLDAATRDRAVFCFKTGRGPKWLQDLGRSYEG
jgi:hypothetical protein